MGHSAPGERNPDRERSHSSRKPGPAREAKPCSSSHCQLDMEHFVLECRTIRLGWDPLRPMCQDDMWPKAHDPHDIAIRAGISTRHRPQAVAHSGPRREIACESAIRPAYLRVARLCSREPRESRDEGATRPRSHPGRREVKTSTEPSGTRIRTQRTRTVRREPFRTRATSRRVRTPTT
jgi:hypothetical protein